jgi:acetylornithine/succinyldiaminopimelate/putrescine aminotransferase|tara:strand:- start:59 stop:220 length:162 start_codon:yes stop_codon:yes gene_type:complete
MQKVLNQFNSNQTQANAMRLVNYINKHPMAMLIASDSDNEALNCAITLIRNVK